MAGAVPVRRLVGVGVRGAAGGKVGVVAVEVEQDVWLPNVCIRGLMSQPASTLMEKHQNHGADRFTEYIHVEYICKLHLLSPKDVCTVDEEYICTLAFSVRQNEYLVLQSRQCKSM